MTPATRSRRAAHVLARMGGPLAALVTAYLAAARPTLTAPTFRAYRRALVGFVRDVQAVHGPAVPPLALTAAHVAAHLAAGPPRGASARGAIVTAIRSWIAWAAREGRVPPAVAHRLAVPKRPVRRVRRAYVEAEARQFTRALEAAGDWLAPRDRVLWALLYADGLEPIAAVALDWPDVNLAGGWLRRPGGRRVPLHAATRAALGAYAPLRTALLVAARQDPAAAPLLVSATGRRLHQESVSEVLRQRARAAGLPGPIPLHPFGRRAGADA